MKKYIDFLKDVLPIVSAFLIICGISKYTIYYGYFNIRIIDYLELSEAITLFTNDLIFILAVLVLSIVLGALYFFFGGVPALNSTLAIGVPQEKFIKHLINYIRSLPKLFSLGIIGFLVLSVLGLIFENKSQFVSNLATAIFITIMMLYGFAVERIQHSYFAKFNALLPFRVIVTPLLLLGFVAMVCKAAYDEYSDVKYLGVNAGVYFQLDNDSIVRSNSHRYFIGQTKNYLFYYDNDSLQTTVYPRNRIKMFAFREQVDKVVKKKLPNRSINQIDSIKLKSRPRKPGT